MNGEVNDHNAKILMSPEKLIHHVQAEHNLPQTKKLQDNKVCGLQSSDHLSVSTQVMFHMHLATQIGLVNGAMLGLSLILSFLMVLPHSNLSSQICDC
jgi:hypothetical protein